MHSRRIQTRELSKLLKAIDDEDVPSMSQLATTGVNLNVLFKGWFGDDSLLMRALHDHKYTAAEFLIKAGADVCFVNDKGMSALKIVVNEDGPYGIIDLLIEHGAQIHVVDSINYFTTIPDHTLVHMRTKYSYVIMRRQVDAALGGVLVPRGNGGFSRPLPQDMLNDILNYTVYPLP